MRKNVTSILFGVVLITAAVVLFGNSVGLWNVRSFDGWWTLFLIVPGLAGLISYGFNIASTCLVLLGAWLLARVQGWLPYPVADNLIWVVILLLIGLKLIFGRGRRHDRMPPNDSVVFDGVRGAYDTRDTVNYSAVLGSMEVSNNSVNLRGGTVSAVFGGATLDLRGAVPMDGAVIEANAVFGGVKLYLPQNCRLQVNGVPFLGGCECTAQRPNDPALPLLTIRYTAVFGGVEIK
jgi:Predicted membrane protein (DUF2154).